MSANGQVADELDQLLERAARAPADLALQRQVVALAQEHGRLSAAIPALERLTRAEPADAVTWRRLGIAELQAGRSAAARDLGATAELIPVPRTVLDSGLDSDTCDLVMSGVAVTADRSLHVRFSSSYLDETIAFVVPDNRVSTFSEWSRVRAAPHLRLGVPLAPYFMQRIREELADAEIVPIDRLDDMFAPHVPPIDAFVATAERGSAYTLLHPEYSVAVPKPRPFKVPLAYVIAGRDSAMSAMVDTWIELKRKDDTIEELFAHWILGQDASPKRPRWSVIDDVLHRTR